MGPYYNRGLKNKSVNAMTMTNPPNFPPPKVFCLPQNGEVINHNGRSYFLGSTIGKGSFGSVYECRDEWRNDLVAKVIIPQPQSTYEAVKQQWLDELQKLIYLRHPNITYVYDAFEYRDTFYLIIERCFSTLDDLIAPHIQGDIWLPYVARDLLQAIDFIHKCGYVHKDIHPGNVFISQVRDKMVPTKNPVWMFKIGDLGISRLESDIKIFTTILAEWMLPPEFLNPPEFGEIGRQVDIYHTGLLLLSVCLGQVPTFTHEEILAGNPRQVAENLPSPYGKVIAKALRRHVTHRTQTAIEFWREIREISEASHILRQ